MKYRLLSVVLLAVSVSAQAQLRSTQSLVFTEGRIDLQPVAESEIPQAPASLAARQRMPQAKQTGAAFYTQTFPSLPAGWTVASNSNSVNGWRWANSAPTGTGNTFPINALINSTTKSDGWLLYNADSVISKRTNSTIPFGGSITSTAIPVGASHTNVMLSFQQYFRYSQGDSCFVDVSKDGTTWTAFPVNPNTSLTQYGFLYRNPTVTTINISSVVGGQTNAYIRFRFNSTAATYSFNWLIDDLTLYDADATDLGITYSGIASGSDTTAGFTRSYSFSSIAKRFADSVYPITYISNYGLSAVNNTAVTAKYYLAGTLLSTQTMNVASVPVGARDSVVVFSTGYKPTSTGDYIVALSIAPAGDGTAQNNADTIRFTVSDSVYATYGTSFNERNCYLTRPSASATPQYWGARFTVANGQRDTVTSVTAAFRPVTAAGQQVQAQLYQASGSGTTFSWNPVAVSYTRTLSAADISTAGNVLMVNFPMRNTGGNFSSLILANGDYAVVLTTVNATGDVALYSLSSPLPTAPSFIGYQGQASNSPNDGTPSFAAGVGIATGLVEVPLVHANFGNAKGMLGISDQEQIVLGAPYPNPASTSLSIPVALKQPGNAQLTLSNPLGQVLASTDLGYLAAGQMKMASVNTASLPEGIYFYTITATGSKASGRIVVKH